MRCSSCQSRVAQECLGTVTAPHNLIEHDHNDRGQNEHQVARECLGTITVPHNLIDRLITRTMLKINITNMSACAHAHQNLNKGSVKQSNSSIEIEALPPPAVKSIVVAVLGHCDYSK